jgi:hypothetical protein
MDICLRADDESTAVADQPNPSAADSTPARPAPAGPAEKGLADILTDAFRLYRASARPMLLICALLFVPASLAKSCVMSAILAPKVAAGSAAEMVDLARAADTSRHALADAYASGADGETITRLQRENQKRLEEMSGQMARLAGDVPGRFTLWVLGVLATLVSALAFAIAVPLVTGAVTIAVADRLTGGQAGWIESWMVLLGRIGPLLAAIVPAAGLIALGLVLWVIPGLVIAFCFSLVAQVAVIEGLTGAPALRRSVDLVGADWLRVALLLGVFLALTWAARLLADLIVPSGHLFMTELVGDLLLLAALPLPLVASALIYLDIRKRRDGFSDDDLRAALASLRA